MAKHIVLPQLKGANWYLSNNFARADKVTDKRSNPELGIEDIALRKVDEGYEGEVDATIRFDNGLLVFGRIFQSKNGQNLVLSFREKKNKDEDGNIIGSYVYNVKVPLEIQAQVLRHAHQFFVEVPGAKEPAPTTVSDDTVVETAMADVAPKAKPKKPTKEELQARAMSMSEEELMKALG